MNYNHIFIIIFSICTVSCGILNGSDETQKDESAYINEVLLNGKPWRDYHPHDPIDNDTVFAPIVKITATGEYNVAIIRKIDYESPYWESLGMHFGFPPETNLDSLETPYTVNFIEPEHNRDTFNFAEYDWDHTINRFADYDSLHPPIATITRFDLENEIIEVEFEGSLIMDPRVDPIESPTRWGDADTLRITEGRIRVNNIDDRR